MDIAKQHWEILQRVPEELARNVREFMVIGSDGDGVLLATENGEGYWLGVMEFEWFEQSKQAMEPTQLDIPNLASMTQGYDHILLLSESGQIYAMGKNDVGQLGQRTVDKETHFSPQLIYNPHKFTSVRCGYWHNLALTEDGKVWAWGFNECGEVGRPISNKFFQSPRKILELDPHRVVAVECGGHHSLALTDQGEVYAWGENQYGQLGYESESSTHTPTRIPTPSPVQSMAAGCFHTLLLTQTGEVYACGRNEYGELGLTTTTKSSASFSFFDIFINKSLQSESSASLVKVANLPSISQIASHFRASFSIAMSAERECFAWGELRNNFCDCLGKRPPFTSIPLQLPPIYSTLDSVLSFGSTSRNTSCSVRIEGQKADSQLELSN